MNGGILVDQHGSIVSVGLASDLRSQAGTVTDFGSHWILPGFCDTHLHFPQLDMISSPGEELLGWLERYTFPTESAFEDTTLAANTAERLVTELYANGTTAAVMFSSNHVGATHALFAESDRRGLRAVIGKSSKDRNAPASMLSDPVKDGEESQELIQRWHGRDGRLFYAVTPRYAPCTSDAMLATHGNLVARYGDLYIQTHLAENVAEIAWVKTLFKGAPDYLSVYESFGLIGPRTILAHCIHLSDSEIQRIAEAKAIVAHCPTSNMFLGSGTLPKNRLKAAGAKITLASDIGAGTSLSQWRTMMAAYQLQRLAGRPFDGASLFWMASGAGYAALGWNGGQLTSGSDADFQVINPDRHRLLGHRLHSSATAEEAVFAMMAHNDDRTVERVYVRGREVYRTM